MLFEGPISEELHPHSEIIKKLNYMEMVRSLVSFIFLVNNNVQYSKPFLL